MNSLSKKSSWSWGKIPRARHRVLQYNWLDSKLPQLKNAETMLPHGCGRSYGDVAINDGGTLLFTKALNRYVSFDRTTGILTCEAGVTLYRILKLVVPTGWFLPVTPGTQFVSIGGAIANDVHGKNHHVAGTFGCHVNGFEILRSSGERCWCSLESSVDLFKASIGGLGLTGLITIVELQLIPINGTMMDIESKSFDNVDQGLDYFEVIQGEGSYSVAWIDCMAQGESLGRGIFTTGEHCKNEFVKERSNSHLGVPYNLPGFSLNKWTVKAFNEAYYRNGKRLQGRRRVDYEPFFYPLDSVRKWNRLYGKTGFYQYQCVVPMGRQGQGRKAIREILTHIAKSGNASFLAVLKVFGNMLSPGLLSFPIPGGITLTLDFPNHGKSTLDLFATLDVIVLENSGRLYPAKDARMPASTFQQGFPAWKEFSRHVDPKFSSSFWRRVTGDL